MDPLSIAASLVTVCPPVPPLQGKTFNKIEVMTHKPKLKQKISSQPTVEMANGISMY